MNFEEAVEFTLFQEGGLVNDAEDPGGITNFGISLRLLLTAITGIGHHVDHIIARRGKTLEGWHVSGLHVSWNLRVCTANENQRKGRFVGQWS